MSPFHFVAVLFEFSNSVRSQKCPFSAFGWQVDISRNILWQGSICRGFAAGQEQVSATGWTRGGERERVDQKDPFPRTAFGRLPSCMVRF